MRARQRRRPSCAGPPVPVVGSGASLHETPLSSFGCGGGRPRPISFEWRGAPIPPSRTRTALLEFGRPGGPHEMARTIRTLTMVLAACVLVALPARAWAQGSVQVVAGDAKVYLSADHGERSRQPRSRRRDAAHREQSRQLVSGAAAERRVRLRSGGLHREIEDQRNGRHVPLPPPRRPPHPRPLRLRAATADRRPRC